MDEAERAALLVLPLPLADRALMLPSEVEAAETGRDEDAKLGTVGFLAETREELSAELIEVLSEVLRAAERRAVDGAEAVLALSAAVFTPLIVGSAVFLAAAAFLPSVAAVLSSFRSLLLPLMAAPCLLDAGAAAPAAGALGAAALPLGGLGATADGVTEEVEAEGAAVAALLVGAAATAGGGADATGAELRPSRGSPVEDERAELDDDDEEEEDDRAEAEEEEEEGS